MLSVKVLVLIQIVPFTLRYGDPSDHFLYLIFSLLVFVVAVCFVSC